MWFVFMFVLIHLKEFLFFLFCFTFKTLCHKLWIQVFQTAKEVKGGLTTLLEPKKVQVKRLPGARKKLNSKRKKKQMRFFFFFFTEDLGEKGYDSEEVGELSFQPRQKLQQGSASVCLQLWINSLEAREPVWWKEMHIPAGRWTPEPGRFEVNALEEPGVAPARPEASAHVSPLISERDILLQQCLPLRGKPEPPSQGGRSEVGDGRERAAPLKLVQRAGPDWEVKVHVYPPKCSLRRPLGLGLDSVWMLLWLRLWLCLGLNLSGFACKHITGSFL